MNFALKLPARINVLGSEAEHLTSERDLIELHRHYLALARPYSVHATARVAPDAVLLEPLQLDAGARIGAGATVGPDVYAGARVLDGEELSGRVRLP